MADAGTIAALIGLGNHLSDSCDRVIKSLRDSAAKKAHVPQLDIIRSYCAILQIAINQICSWASTKLPKSSVPTSSVIAVQAAVASLLEFIQLLHDEVQKTIKKATAEQLGDARETLSASESSLGTLSEQIQVLAGSLQLMVAATMM